MSPFFILITLALCYSNIPSQLLHDLLIPLGLCTSYSGCLVLSSPDILTTLSLPSFRTLLTVRPHQRGFWDYAPLVSIPVALWPWALLHFSYYCLSQQINMCIACLLQLECRETLERNKISHKERNFVLSPVTHVYPVPKIVHSRYSENICWMNKGMNERVMLYKKSKRK